MSRTAPLSRTRDSLDDPSPRQMAFATVGDVFERHGFCPWEMPAFERLEVLVGKYGEDAPGILSEMLHRTCEQGTGEPGLALRHHHMIPLPQAMGSYEAKLSRPCKRYSIGPVWRAEPAGEGRFREFVQCDIDTVGSASPLADAEIVHALADALAALGVERYRFLVNSRQALRGLLQIPGVDEENSDGVLGTLNRLNKVGIEAVEKELVDEHGLDRMTAQHLVDDLASEDPGPVRSRIARNERGRLGLSQIDCLLELTADLGDRIGFAPHMMYGADHDTGAVYQVEAEGHLGSIASGGRHDGLITSLGGPDMPACGGSIDIERILARRNTAPAP